MVEFNCETDFVGKSTAFLHAYGKLMNLIVNENITELEQFLKSKYEGSITIEEFIKETITKTGENCKLRFLTKIEG